MKTLEPKLVDSPLPHARRSFNGMPHRAEHDQPGRHKFDLSDYLLLTGVVLVPFMAPIPGPTNAHPSGWTERVGPCDAFFILAMLVAAWQRTRQGLSDWLNRRPRGVSSVSALDEATWTLPPISPIWFCTAAMLAVMVLSWFPNSLKPINSHMLAAMAAQIYLAAVSMMCASAVYRYGTPRPLLVAWVIAFLPLTIICTYDSAALLLNRSMIYPTVEGRLRGPFRATEQMASYMLLSFFILFAAARFASQSRWVSKAGMLAWAAPAFIVLASRRSALAALVAGYVALLAVSKHRMRILMGTVVPATMIVVGLFLFSPPDMQAYMMDRVRPLIGQNEGRVNIAVNHFDRGMSAFKEHPVLGVGFGAFSGTRYGEYSEKITHEQHNGYLAILAETGAIGFSILVLLHLAVFAQLVRVWWSPSGRYRELALYLMVALASVGVSEIYNRVWRERGVWIIVGMIAALPTIALRNRLADSRQAIVLNGSNRLRNITSRLT
jgi:O-antigen ligase